MCKIFLGKGFVGLRSGGTFGTDFFEVLGWVKELVEEASPEESDTTDSSAAISSSATSSSTSSPWSMLSTPSSVVFCWLNLGSSFAGVDLGRGIRSGVDNDNGLLRWVRDPERRRCLVIDGDTLCPDITLNDSCTMYTVVPVG